MTPPTEPTGAAPVADHTGAAVQDVDVYMARKYERVAASVVRELRDIADDVERKLKVKAGFLAAAAYATHGIHNGLANVNVSGLIRAAGDADRAARTPEGES